MLESDRHSRRALLRKEVEAVPFPARFDLPRRSAASTFRALSRWPSHDTELLAELATGLEGQVEELSAEWAERLVLQLDTVRHNSPALETLAWVNTWYLKDHF